MNPFTFTATFSELQAQFVTNIFWMNFSERTLNNIMLALVEIKIIMLIQLGEIMMVVSSI